MGCVPFVVILSFYFVAPSAPRGFSLSPVTSNPRALQANWTIPETPNGVIRNYTITCNNSETFTIGRFEDQIVTFILNMNFDPFTVYECSVSAATNGGVGGSSEISVAMTAEDG
jgi:hypothetical protein